MSSSGAVQYQTSSLNYERNGGVASFFKSGAEPSSFIVQFEDMSLHFIGGEPDQLNLRWSREEGLSGINQLEIADPSVDNRERAQTFDYIKNWDETVSLEQVPQKILARYTENINHLVTMLFSTRELTAEEALADANQNDVYGFKKTLVALTNFGKIVGVSSYNGMLLWTSSFSPSSNAPQKIMIRRNFVREDEYTQSQVVSVFSDSLRFMSAATGQVLYSQNLKRPADQFMLINLRESKSQFVLAVNHEDLEKPDAPLHAYPSAELPQNVDLR